MKIKIFNPG